MRGMVMPVAAGRIALGLGLAAVLLVMPAGAARAQTGSYADRARATIAHLLEGRDYAPEAGCDRVAECTALLARLRAGDFTVIAPAESSDRPDMPSYLRERKRCPGLDPLRITAAHRVYAATHGFAVYRLRLPGRGKRVDEILVFRAEHYVPLERGRTPAAGQTALIPGTFVAVATSGCRLLASARAVDGDWLAKHNAIADDDHASELIKMGGRYFVLNLAPIAGPRQPKPSWWYALELWDLGPRVGADHVHQRAVFTFGYKPDAVPSAAGPSDASRVASGATARSTPR